MGKRCGYCEVLICAATALSLQAGPSAQTATGFLSGDSPPPSPVSGTSTVRGRVLAADTGRAVRGARVQVSGGPLPTARATMVDAAGGYEFKNLPAGRFTVSASAPAFIGLSYGQTRPFEAGKPIVLADKQQVENLNLRLPRGGAITGMIVDDRGQPIISAAVVALRSQYVRGLRQFAQAGRALTNDLGEYRIYGLAPGAYVVAASKGYAMSPEWTSTAGTGFPLTYFPGAISETNASRVDVSLGQTRRNVTFSLDAGKSGAIGGATFLANGQPGMVGNASTSVRPINRGDSALLVPRMVLSGDGIHGSFLAQGLSPGDYDVRALSSSSAGVPQGAALRVSVNGDTITDLKLLMQPLPAATGRVTIDPSSTASVSMAAIRLTLETIDAADPRRFPQPASPAPDGAFTIYGPAGPARIRPTLPNGWALKAVRVRGEDVTDTGFEFRDGDALSDIEVEVTNRLTAVSGSARDAKGQPAPDYAVILFSRDRQRWTGDARYFMTARPDQAGVFAASGLAPGEYYAAALDYLDPAEAQSPALLDRLGREATPFALREGEARQLELKVLEP